MKRTLTLLALGVALGGSGCASDPMRPRLFSTDWQDDQGASIDAVYARTRSGALPPNADVVVAVAKSGKQLVGLPLGGGARWTHDHALDARPTVVGSVVVAQGAGELFALDALTGKKLWARPSGAVPFIGAGDDGKVTVVALGQSSGDGTILLSVARDGSVKRQIETDKALGVPAVAYGHVFVPWGNQYVSVFDMGAGDELGRVVVRDKVSRAYTQGGALYFGEVGLVRWDEKIREASRGGASRIAIPPRELPGTPRLLVPAREKVGPRASALDRARLFARPASGPALGFDGDRVYATYFRAAMGMSGKGGQLAWVHLHDGEILGGEAVKGGLVLCDEAGKVFGLDGAHGEKTLALDLGGPIQSCVVSTDVFAVPALSGRAPRGLSAQIGEVLLSREATLATAQRLLLRELATMSDESATKTLIDLATDPRTAPVLVADARAAIANRRTGAPHMMAALRRRYDFLKDVLVPPPVGPIAQALAAMKETQAAPLLASFLSDPSITDDDVKQCAAALVVLGTAAEVPALRQFFTQVRAAAEPDDVAHAAVSAAEALIKLGGRDGRAVVVAASKDAATTPFVKTRIEALLAALPAAPEPEPPPPEPSATPAKRPPAKPPAPKPGPPKPVPPQPKK